jgi:hypothetical protein
MKLVKPLLKFVLCTMLAWGTSAPIVAQAPAPPQKPPVGSLQDQGGLRPENEVQQLIEALYISRLQEDLKLNDEQYAAVIPAVKNFLRVRQTGAKHRHEVERELNRMLGEGASDDQLQAKLKELDQVKKQNENDLDAAHTEIDAKLDVKQRARFQQYQEHIDQHIQRMIQQIREGRRGHRMQQRQGPQQQSPGVPPTMN